MMVLNRYRFLFQRFTVQCYWFTPVYLVRNFTITILPVVFADDGHRQVFMLASVFMFFGFTQCWLKPWRGFLPNLLDIITTFCLVMALVGAALLDSADYDLVVQDMPGVYPHSTPTMVRETSHAVGDDFWCICAVDIL
jgi:fucose 4-O-acetylase-like acetyltransferase